MSDSDEKSEPPKAQSPPPQTTNTDATGDNSARDLADLPPKATVEQAKTFLKDGLVRSETRERKIAFLKGKGLEEAEINELLDELENAPDDEQSKDGSQESQSQSQSHNASSDDSSRPPIITYPEFLTTPTKPPPLVTMSGFLNTVVAFGGLSSLIYATSQLVLQPMVESLTDARLDLHSTARANLTQLIEKLEATVSEIPSYDSIASSTKALAEKEDDARSDSTYDDPTELFHRDVGVQTSPPPSPDVGSAPGTTVPEKSGPAYHTKIVSDLVSSLREIREGCDNDVDEYADVRASLNTLRDEVVKVSSNSRSTYNQYAGIYGSTNSAYNFHEPDDEIKRVKESIRRVKGVLLSSRSFPARAV